VSLALIAAAAAPAKAAAAPVKAAASAAPAPLTPQQAQLQAQAAAPQHFTVFQQHFGWLTHTLAGIFILAAVLLIALLAVQTTKQEGLSGSIGGAVQSAYGRPGAEEQLKRITGFMAVTFVVIGTILSLTGI